MQPHWNWTELLDRLSRGAGVLGRVRGVALGALLVLAVIAFRLNDPKMLLILAGIVFAVLFVTAVGMLVYAHLNPAVAVLEGRDLIDYRQLDVGAKDAGLLLNVTPPIPNPASPKLAGTETGGERA